MAETRELFQEAFDINNLKALRKGMASSEVKLYYKEPQKIENQQLSNGTKARKVYLLWFYCSFGK